MKKRLILLFFIVFFVPKVTNASHVFDSLLERVASPLFVAIANDDKDKVLELFNEGVSANESHFGIHALVFAEYYADVDIMRLLLKHGADPNVKNFYGHPLLYQVIRFNAGSSARRRALVDLLLRHGADPQTSFMGQTILSMAVGLNDVEVVRALLEYGADPQVSSIGYTPLGMAVIRASDIEIVRLLLEYGADSNSKLKVNYPLLCHAIMTEQSDIALLLLKHGANPHIHCARMHVLCHAIALHYEEVVKALLEAGVDQAEVRKCIIRNSLGVM
jgi:ankyrin repeat protein